jgi:hypothetical protein
MAFATTYDFYDQVVTIEVEKDSNCFFDESKNP